MANVQIQAIGLEKALIKITKMQGAVKNLSPAFDDMKNVIVQEFKSNFDSAGKNLQLPWVPRKRFYPWPILIKTGKLKSNWESKVQPTELKISNPTEYATYHHFGTPKLPERKIIAASETIKKIIKDRVTKYLKTYF